MTNRAAALLLLGPSLLAFAAAGEGAVIRSGAGPDAASIQGVVDLFRTDLGAFQEISWDGVPDSLSAPNFLPGDFFNSRGAFFSTPGSGIQTSADSSNPTGTPVRFGHINPTYPDIFQTFSPERLFSPIDSNIVDMTFVVPGTGIAALTTGFGAIYADADILHVTSFEYFDGSGASLGQFSVPVANSGLSFLGVSFGSPVVARVRIVYGNVALGPIDGNGVDVAVMDNFVYGTPQAVPEPSTLALLGAAALVCTRRIRHGRRDSTQ